MCACFVVQGGKKKIKIKKINKRLLASCSFDGTTAIWARGDDGGKNKFLIFMCVCVSGGRGCFFGMFGSSSFLFSGRAK